MHYNCRIDSCYIENNINVICIRNSHQKRVFSFIPIALKTAKPPHSSGRSECNRIKITEYLNRNHFI